MKLSYRPHQFDTFYRRIFQLPYDTKKCSISAFISLSSRKNMNSFSFYSDCLELLVDSLLFQNLAHRIYYPTTKQEICNQPHNFTSLYGTKNFGLVVHSLIKDTYPGNSMQLGIYFQLMRSYLGADFSLGYKSMLQERVGLLYSVKVTVFDTYFVTQIALKSNEATFKGSANLFGKSFYHVTMEGRAETQATWNDLTLKLTGWFSNASEMFLQTLKKSINDEIRTRAAGAMDRKEEAEKQRNVSSVNLKQLKNQLLVTNHSLINLMKEYEQAKNELHQANNTLKEANEVIFNKSEELQDLELALDTVCQVKICPSKCISATRTRKVYKDQFVSVLGVCESLCNVTVQVRVSPFHVPTTVWRFTQVCGSKEIVCSFDTTCLRNETGCRWVCKSVPALKPVYNYNPVVVERLCFKPCNKSVYSSSIKVTESYIDDCALTAPEPNCTADNEACDKEKEKLLNLIEVRRQDLVRPIRRQNAARRSLARAEMEVARSKLAKETAESAYAAIEAQVAIGEKVANASHQNYLKILSSIGSDLNLIDLTQERQDVISISNISFDVTLRGLTPVVFPINFIVELLPRHQQFIFTTNYDFMQDFNAQKSSLVDSIIAYVIPSSNRKKRAINDDTNIANNGELQFEIRCAELKSINNFINFLGESMLEVSILSTALAENLTELQRHLMTELHNLYSTSFGNFNYTNVKQLFNVSQEELDNEPNVNIEDSLLDAILATFADINSSANNIVENLNFSFFHQWQNEMEALLLEEGTIGDKDCYGFSDCLRVTASLLEELLSFSPIEIRSNLQEQFIIASPDLLKLAISTNITIDEALNLLAPLMSLLDKMNETGYWCATAPEITSHPVPEKNISVGSALILNCFGTSNLPITYQWKKNGIIIPDAHFETLNISNFQVYDEGNYTCEITNAVRTVKSTNSSIHAFILPEFYLTPLSVVTYVGSTDGAYFTCNATSHPDPGWKWYYTQTLESDSAWKELIGEEINELIVIKPNKSQEGYYRCMAYNDFGNLSSQPVFLKLVSATSRVFTLPVEFTMTKRGGTMKRELLEKENEESIEVQIYKKLKESIDFESVTISEIRLEYSTDQSFLLAFFTLYSANTTTPNMIEDSLPDIVLRQRISKEQLNGVQNRLKEFFKTKEFQVTLNDEMFRSNHDSFTARQPGILCPEGQALDPDQLLCSK